MERFTAYFAERVIGTVVLWREKSPQTLENEAHAQGLIEALFMGVGREEGELLLGDAGISF